MDSFVLNAFSMQYWIGGRRLHSLMLPEQMERVVRWFQEARDAIEIQIHSAEMR